MFLTISLPCWSQADEIKSGSVGSRASGDFIKQLRDLLGGAQEARAIVVALKPDFWKIKTIVQAADMVMWPLQLTGERSIFGLLNDRVTSAHSILNSNPLARGACLVYNLCEWRHSFTLRMLSLPLR